jgi:hypothetical protein
MKPLTQEDVLFAINQSVEYLDAGLFSVWVGWTVWQYQIG